MSTIAVTPSVFSLNAEQKKRLSDFNAPLKLWFWLLIKLPSAWFMGMRVKNISPEKGEVTLPYGWRSQNPFQSIYFAAQCAAAEFSTGALATLAIAGRGKVSMLVTNLEAEFVKKANTEVVFTCEDGNAVFETVEKAIQTGEAQVLTMVSKGVQATGEVVSIVKITWSFKAKKMIGE
jgi:acyl-coenzyme A thioesterase PaaI-like protein